MVWVAGDKESIDRVIAGAGEHGPKTVRKEVPEHSPRSGRRSAVPGRIVDKLSIKRRLVLYFCV